MSGRTFTYTWTQTRLDTIQDQFRYFMTYGGIDDKDIDDVVYGVGEKAVQAVGLFACDSSGLRVIEAELSVDWELSATLSLSVPNIGSGLTGWDDRQAPEVKVAGRRFAQTAEQLQLETRFWIRFVRPVLNDEQLHKSWCERLRLAYGTSLPGWREQAEEVSETLLDLPEVQVSLRRRAGG